jgi:predicted Rossmann fold flavoprotein
MNKPRIVVIGGGAAGFFGAIACAEAHPGAEVVILEKTRQLLTKVRISGGGRCNVTHSCFVPQQLTKHYPRGHKALQGPFTRFQPTDTIEWFKKRGVALKTEPDGRMFPTSNCSETIIACLQQEAKKGGVDIRLQTEVVEIKKDKHFCLRLNSGEELTCDQILLATGSNAKVHELLKTLGHRIIPPVPSLFTFNIADERLEGLAGISVPKVHLHLLDTPLKETGPLLITHWGLSGPAVLKLSAWGARLLHERQYEATLSINWLPDLTQQQVVEMLKKQAPQRTVIGENCFQLPKNLWRKLVLAAGIGEDLLFAHLSKKQMHALQEQLLQGRFAVRGKSTHKEEFVTAGGVDLDEINFQTMESRVCPGLHFAGEVLDIDGITGGFNFQNAWTTSWLAAQSMNKKPEK